MLALIIPFVVGQTKEVKVIKLLTKETIEENIYRCAQLKLKLDKSISAAQTQDTEGDENGILVVQDVPRLIFKAPPEDPSTIMSILREEFMLDD